jgi:hypothetical protein
MEPRFWLRIESGERGGETVPIPAEGLLVGRSPDAGLVLADGSVSGQHAELQVGGERVYLRDLGSTNGTRIGGQRLEPRIESRPLEPGDRVRLGTVALTFLERDPDGEPAAAPSEEAGSGGPFAGEELLLEDLDAPAAAPTAPTAPAPRPVPREPAPAPAAAPAPAGAEVVLEGPDLVLPTEPAADGDDESFSTISEERLARAGRRSGPWLVLLVLALAGTLAVVWLRLGARDDLGVARRASVEAMPGDLLAGAGEFEPGLGALAWEPDAAGGFDEGASGARTGRGGAGVELEPGGSARSASAPLAVNARALRLTAALRADPGVDLRVGIALEGEAGGAPAGVAWSAPAGTDWTDVEVTAPVPAGTRSARVLIDARGAGGGGAGDAEPLRAWADEVRLTAGAGAGAGLAFEESRLLPLGAPPREAALARIDRVLAGGIALRRAGEPLVLALEATDTGFALGAPGADRLVLAVDPELAAQRVAVLGDGGFREQAGAFEADGVTSLLVGRGHDLVRVRPAGPVRVSASTGDVPRITLEGELDRVELQLSFRAERGRAAQLAGAAREAERKGRPGASLAAWTELLETAPFDDTLVREASAARARLVETGMADVRRLEEAHASARFFEVASLHREVRAAARTLALRWDGSEVGAATRALETEIALELDGLEESERTERRAALRGVLEVLEARGDSALGAHVRRELGPGAPEDEPEDEPTEAVLGGEEG